MTDTIPPSPAGAQNDGPAQQPAGQVPLRQRTQRQPRLKGAARPARPELRSRLELAALLLGTSALYLWNLGASGWANAFYSAAAQAGGATGAGRSPGARPRRFPPSQ